MIGRGVLVDRIERVVTVDLVVGMLIVEGRVKRDVGEVPTEGTVIFIGDVLVTVTGRVERELIKFRDGNTGRLIIGVFIVEEYERVLGI
ncbi:MAG: hypothetical protein D3916_10250 [Candidatus Electrothrix sp. MAN1_4]|nr:hypothetical protein [Candidatus Electrothrix sp. MAN1_4]